MKVAVVGVGRWGKNHARVLRDLRDEGIVDEVAVVDKDIGRAKEIADRYGIERYYSNINEIRSFDAAIVAVPTIYHYPVAKKLLELNLNLLVEKPLATTIEEAKDLVLYSKSKGLKLGVGHIERFNQGVNMVKEVLNNAISCGDEIVYISAQRIGPGFPSRYALNLGVAHDLLVHDVDIIVYLLGKLPKSVQANVIRNQSFPYEIEVNANLLFSENIIANVRASWRTSPKFKKRILTIQTTESVITLDYILQSVIIERGTMIHSSSVDFESLLLAYQAREFLEKRLIPSRKMEPLYLEIKSFLEAVNKDKDPLVNGVDGYIAVKIVNATLESATKGNIVRLEWNEPFL